ncbi:MAG: DNA mismatch repair endonuclease MutL [Candidatus Hodarchaeales archaeon]
MSKRIHRLDDLLISKIAAGEVVERPASVIKELIENSIDANSTRIVIEVVDGGKKLIRVNDNGSGMTREDAQICLDRYTTSKIHLEEDLLDIRTLGFRGEFLASVSAVSKLVIKTKDASSDTGIVISSNPVGSKIKRTVSTTPMKKGTTVEITNLFFNVPAREKYLKKERTELARIIDVVKAFILANDTIEFVLKSNGKLLLKAGISTNYRDRLAMVFGKELAKRMIRVKNKKSLYQIDGFISKPIDRRKSREQIYIFLNGRIIKNNIFISALEESYHTLLFKNEYPIAVLRIRLDNSMFDPNVHPTKRIVRFYEESEIIEFVRDSISSSLLSTGFLKPSSTGKMEPLTSFPGIKVKEGKKRLIDSRSNAIYIEKRTKSQQDGRIRRLETRNADIDQPMDKLEISSLDVIGQYIHTYIIAQKDTDLYIIDQHAAAERITYESVLKRIKTSEKKRVMLLEPIIIRLSSLEIDIAYKNKSILHDLGFQFNNSGIDSVKLTSIPLVKGIEGPKEVFLDLINRLTRSKTPRDEFTELVAKSIACHTSIRAGDTLSQKMMDNLLMELSETERPFTCPHGRPIIIKLPKKDVEKIFKRIQ